MGSVFYTGTLSTADPFTAFTAGWFLSAYFLEGYVKDGRGMNGYSNAVIAAAKNHVLWVGYPSWSGNKSSDNMTSTTVEFYPCDH